MTARLIAVVLLFTSAACAQIQSESSDVVRRLRVRIAFSDHAPCDSSTRVVLTGAMGFALAQGSVNGECVAEFFDVPSGAYRVSVSGANATNADEGEVEVNPVISQELEVRAKHTSVSDGGSWVSGAAFISLSDLAMPAKAAREFEKANRFIAKQQWKNAIERLQKGIAIYPRYAAGYNNLGAVYSHMGDASDAREALRKALKLDDHLAPAYVNLARLSFLDKDFSNAEMLLTRALTVEPAANADELILAAYAQLEDHHLDQAIQTSHQGHAARFDHHAFLHLVAANAYEQESRSADCIAELQLYLTEQPNGPQAEKVRTALATLEARTATAGSLARQ
jgi:tetratricopeptide (TPR) repeat protein